MTRTPAEFQLPTPEHADAGAPPRMTRRRLLRGAVRAGIGFSAASLGALAYAHNVEPLRLRVNRLDVKIPGLPAAFDGLVVAHLSDIHMDDWMDAARIASAARLATSLKPDIIALTGDFISRDLRTRDSAGRFIGDAKARMAPGLAQSLSLLSAPLGVFAVQGNHDHWSGGPTMSFLLQQAGIRELDNRAAPIERDGQRLWLCGVDDAWVGAADLEQVLGALENQARPNEPAILLAHEPDFADHAALSGRFALQLSGHSHGGQVAIPLFGPLILPPMGRKYHTGLNRVSDSSSAMQVFTTRGVGVVGPRVRFNCPPEIALLTLRPA
jgi:predicted MPP superfamily phosphohydrolase